MRTQIALHPEHHAQVKRRAAESGISMAEYIRRLVERDLRRPEARSDLSAIVGMGASGRADAAAFDRDYSIYRFGQDRRQAFTVHT